METTDFKYDASIELSENIVKFESIDPGENKEDFNLLISMETSNSFSPCKILIIDIHKVKLDHTVSEYAVKKGAIVGASLTTILFLIKFKAIKEFFNFKKLFKTANIAYKTSTTIIPISSIGWVVYDFFNGERELILNPIRRK